MDGSFLIGTQPVTPLGGVRQRESGKAEEVKTEVQGKVGEGKDASAQEITETTAAVPEPAPDAKQVVPMAPDKAPAKPGAPNPAQAAPDELPPSATDMSAGPHQVKEQMAEAKVTERQLSFKNSREPALDKAARETKSMDTHSQAAPKKLRAEESANSNRSRIPPQYKVRPRWRSSTPPCHHRQAGRHCQEGHEEERRGQAQRGHRLLQKVFDKTKCDVEKILSDLDKRWQPLA